MMAFVLKANGFQNKALKLCSPISSVSKLRKLCVFKFSLKDNVNGKLQKLTSIFGYGVGIAMFFGISNFHFCRTECPNIIPANSTYKFSYCEAAMPPNDKKPHSPRNNFNFLADVVERTQNSVVYIEINARQKYTGELIPISNGSGFIVKEDGLILTNAHVVNHYGQVTVKLYDGTKFFGVVENLDTESDLATVRIKAKNLEALPLGCSSDIRPGEFVIAMGNPLTLSHTITAGVVSSANRKGKELGLHKMSDYIQTDATIHVGNSGGPLVNLDGEVIGINTMKVTEGISFAIPSDRAIEFLKSSKDSSAGGLNFQKFSGPGKNKFLGLTLFTLSPSVIKELKERNPDFPSVDHGVLVWRVMYNSPSYDAGIRPGDVITKVNRKEAVSTDIILNMLKHEDTLELTVHRGQNTFKVTVSLVEPVMP